MKNLCIKPFLLAIEWYTNVPIILYRFPIVFNNFLYFLYLAFITISKTHQQLKCCNVSVIAYIRIIKTKRSVRNKDYKRSITSTRDLICTLTTTKFATNHVFAHHITRFWNISFRGPVMTIYLKSSFIRDKTSRLRLVSFICCKCLRTRAY